MRVRQAGSLQVVEHQDEEHQMGTVIVKWGCRGDAVICDVLSKENIFERVLIGGALSA